MASFEDAYNQYAQGGQGKAVAQIYDAQQNANLARMEEEYNRARGQAEANAAKIPGMYQQQANDLNAQAERQRRNFNMAAQANGLNTGTGAQAQLAQNAAYQRAYGQIGTAQANAQTEAQRQLADMEAAYRSQVNQAMATGDYQKATALLQGYQQDRDRQLAEAQRLAAYGIFDGYNNVYGQDTTNAMRAMWQAQNPDLAWRTGAITAEDYHRMTGQWPAGYTPPVTAGGGGVYYVAPKTKDKDTDTDKGAGTGNGTTGTQRAAGTAPGAGTQAVLPGGTQVDQYSNYLQGLGFRPGTTQFNNMMRTAGANPYAEVVKKTVR